MASYLRRKAAKIINKMVTRKIVLYPMGDHTVLYCNADVERAFRRVQPKSRVFDYRAPNMGNLNGSPTTNEETRE